MKRIYLLLTFIILSITAFSQLPIPTFSVILGRPTDTSITASIQSNKRIQYYIEFGTQTGTYNRTTSVFRRVSKYPEEVNINGLAANTKYYYRVRYRLVGHTVYRALPAVGEYTFRTQRAAGSTYTFTIESDMHLNDSTKGSPNIYGVTLANEALDQPDFIISLGDAFDHENRDMETHTSAMYDEKHSIYRPLLGAVCHSIPYYFVLGNHDGENQVWLQTTPPNNIAVWNTKWRKSYFPNPFPNTFYSGNTTTESYGMGRPENYYSWTWGDALFVAIDMYRYDGGGSGTGTENPAGWTWTLGQTQYNWLKSVLEGSSAKYKFVFCHHLRGNVRGITPTYKLYEWGGLDSDTLTNTFTANRPGWAKPIHQLLIDTKVTAFIQGHDHTYSKETIDGVKYISTPICADSTYLLGDLYGSVAPYTNHIGGTGYLKVTVSPTSATVSYMSTYLPADVNGTTRINHTTLDTITLSPNP